MVIQLFLINFQVDLQPISIQQQKKSVNYTSIPSLFRSLALFTLLYQNIHCLLLLMPVIMQ